MHTKTDPACHFHRVPTTRFQRWLFDQYRGIRCAPCMTADTDPALDDYRDTIDLIRRAYSSGSGSES